MPRITEDIRTEDAQLREIAAERDEGESCPGDYYASKTADAHTLREALAYAEAHGDTAGAARIREALELTEYVGD